MSLPPGSGLIGSYHHGGPSLGLGRIGGIVVLGVPCSRSLHHGTILHFVLMAAQAVALQPLRARRNWRSSLPCTWSRQGLPTLALQTSTHSRFSSILSSSRSKCVPSLFPLCFLGIAPALLRLQSAGLEKPPAVKQKIVEGQMNKWCGANTIMESRCARGIKDIPCLRRFSEVCLLDQPFVVDDSMSVKVR